MSTVGRQFFHTKRQNTGWRFQAWVEKWGIRNGEKLFNAYEVLLWPVVSSVLQLDIVTGSSANLLSTTGLFTLNCFVLGLES